MKNYRRLDPYKPEEWENNNEWLGKRLCFIWDLMEIFPTEERPGISIEKNQLYALGNEIYRIAKKESSYNEALIRLWENRDITTIYRDFRRLEKLKRTTINEFFKKINSYYYIWIQDNKYEEIMNYEIENENIILAVYGNFLFRTDLQQLEG